jgi:hypothetical protein
MRRIEPFFTELQLDHEADPMSTDYLHRRPIRAAGILLVGALAYGVLSLPAVTERGYPRIDPVWQAVPWLWFIPIAISGVYDDGRRRRIGSLVTYGLFAGFILAGVMTPSLTPRRVSVLGMLIGTAFLGPVIVGLGLLVERGVQKFLRHVRVFVDDDRCARCGYCIRHLPLARCPECGTPFDERRLGIVNALLEPTPRPVRTRAVVAALLLATAAIPPVYQWIALRQAAHRGWMIAKQHWSQGKAVLFLEGTRWPDFQWEKWSPVDPLSGLPVRRIFEGMERVAWQRAYSAAVEEELSKTGRGAITKCLLTHDEMIQGVNRLTLRTIDGLPFRLSEMLSIDRLGEKLAANGVALELPADVSPCGYGIDPAHGGVIFVVVMDEAVTLLPDGTPLQYVDLAGSR